VTHRLWATVALKVGFVTLALGDRYGWIVAGRRAGWRARSTARGQGCGCRGDISPGASGAASGAAICGSAR